MPRTVRRILGTTKKLVAAVRDASDDIAATRKNKGLSDDHRRE